MKPADLHTIWSAPDNTRLTTKQYSFRLPTHVAAQIEALCEMYPTKNRTQIVADLLASALKQVELSYPEVKGQFVASDINAGDFYEDVGLSKTYRSLSDKHFIALEKEQGNAEPKPLFGSLNVMCIEPDHSIGEWGNP